MRKKVEPYNLSEEKRTVTELYRLPLSERADAFKNYFKSKPQMSYRMFCKLFH